MARDYEPGMGKRQGTNHASQKQTTLQEAYPTIAVSFPRDPTASAGFTGDLLALLARDDGWLRAVPADGGKVVYWKWKWTSGAWSGYYVMVVTEEGTHYTASSLLREKVEQTIAGTRRPTKDRAYSAND